MATELAGVADVEPAPAHGEAASIAVPYPSSWIDRLILWIEDRPGPTWLAYLVVGGAMVALALASAIVVGRTGPVELAIYSFWGAAIALSLLLIHYLADVAGHALDAFRPVLGVDDATAARLRYELTVIPSRPALVILIVTAIITPIFWWLDPASSSVVGAGAPELSLRYLNETAFGAILLTLLYQSLRQLRAVHRIHASAKRVDLFRPAPLYAFSIFTSRTAILLALVFTVPSGVAAFQASGAGADLVFIAFSAIGVVAGAAVFVVPLLAMQRRIILEKQRLQSEVGARIETTIAAVHAAVDSGDLTGAAAMNGTLGVLVAERQLVDHLPTLPWRPGTLGAVVTVIVVPLVLSLATRLLERVV